MFALFVKRVVVWIIGNREEMEIRCVKNGWAIRFEVPPGIDPTEHGKKKLREITGKKRLVGWTFETVV